MQQSALAFAFLLALAACSDSEPSTASAAPATVGDEVADAAHSAAQSAAAATPAAPETIDLGEGLTVEILERGQGDPARLGCELLVHFTARVDGADQPFDSSYSRGLPDRWRLSASEAPRLIAGLVKGLAGLPEGTRAVLHIPSALGYGAEGRPGAGIPADSALVYEVKLIDVLP
jgi:FKBP-type peptidyl-prolyl cis-trans isomerase